MATKEALIKILKRCTKENTLRSSELLSLGFNYAFVAEKRMFYSPLRNTESTAYD